MSASVVYLHGFASSPQSHKAIHFRAHFAGRGDAFLAPDLNAPDFADLTLARMITASHTAAAQLPQDRPLIAVGSSLGGLAATLFACERAVLGKPLSALVLIAPAFELASLWHRRLGKARLAAWRRDGEIELKDDQGNYVYGPGFPRLRFGFYADAMRRDTQTQNRSTGCKTLILHGELDREVPVAVSQRYSAGKDDVRLVTFPGAGHSLQQELDALGEHIDRFLAGAP